MNPKNKEHLNKPWVKALLAQPVLARLATANPKTLQPHVVPVWFLWDGESLWISAFVSTRKVKDIQRNQRIAVLIDVDRVEGQPDRAVLLEGACELIADPAVVAPRSLSLYTHYLGEAGVKASEPQSWAVDPENRIIKLIPEKVFAWGPGE